ncbi:hypothetical protein HMPREF1326_01613 [Akkermansia sp. KLE1605]|nr:hypothetical protein HMPREF1326_01613 [Akkermansia sp. KLE1605]
MLRQHTIHGLMLNSLIRFKRFFVESKEPMPLPISRHLAHQLFLLSPVHSPGKRSMKTIVFSRNLLTGESIPCFIFIDNPKERTVI